MAKSCESQEFLVEVLGTISNLSYQGTAEIVPYHELIMQYNMLDWFTKLLAHTMMEDDLLVSIIMVIGCFAATAKSCALFAEPRLLRLLVCDHRMLTFCLSSGTTRFLLKFAVNFDCKHARSPSFALSPSFRFNTLWTSYTMKKSHCSLSIPFSNCYCIVIRGNIFAENLSASK